MVDLSLLIYHRLSCTAAPLCNTHQVRFPPGWSNQLFSKAAASKGPRHTHCGMSRVRAMRERCWRLVSPSWNGNLLTVKDPRNQVTTIAYNTFGQPLSVQGPIATEPPTTFSYDANGNLITTTDPLGNATQRVYDAVSRLTNLTDPKGLQTQFRYDGLNRVTEIADARQGITRFAYDPNGNLLSVTDAKNQSTSYTYN
jgi:YD repeat-containing protein